MVFSIIILSVSLSIDALFVGFAYGLKGTRVPVSSKLIICLFSLLYSSLAVFAGNTISRFIPPFAGKLIGAVILGAIGLVMLLKSFIKEKKRKYKTRHEQNLNDRTILKVIFKPLGITIQILRNPDAGDVDRSGVIDIKESILLGSALSVDAVGVGIGSALSGLGGWYVPLSIGLFQLLFLNAGLLAGSRFSCFKNLGGKATDIIPGVLLIALSLFRLI